MNNKRVKTELLIHDLKNPLAVIETGIHLLLREIDKYGPLTDRQVKVLGRAMRNTKIAMGLVNDIMEISRSKDGIISREHCRCFDVILAPLVEIFDLFYPHNAERIGACRDVDEMIKELAKDNILLKIEESLLSRDLYLDVRKIRQIIRNLLSNAMKFRREIIVIRMGVKEGNLYISIQDDGKGISSEYHKKIFESYFQLGNERELCVRGHGLGLAGSLMLVEDMGGKMEIESDEGKGATFIVKLPI